MATLINHLQLYFLKMKYSKYFVFQMSTHHILTSGLFTADCCHGLVENTCFWSENQSKNATNHFKLQPLNMRIHPVFKAGIQSWNLVFPSNKIQAVWTTISVRLEPLLLERNRKKILAYTVNIITSMKKRERKETSYWHNSICSAFFWCWSTPC